MSTTPAPSASARSASRSAAPWLHGSNTPCCAAGFGWRCRRRAPSATQRVCSCRPQRPRRCQRGALLAARRVATHRRRGPWLSGPAASPTCGWPTCVGRRAPPRRSASATSSADTARSDEHDELVAVDDLVGGAGRLVAVANTLRPRRVVRRSWRSGRGRCDDRRGAKTSTASPAPKRPSTSATPTDKQRTPAGDQRPSGALVDLEASMGLDGEGDPELARRQRVGLGTDDGADAGALGDGVGDHIGPVRSRRSRW